MAYVLRKKDQAGSLFAAESQGSVLGPLLFLIFTNDLEDKIRSNILKFADHTN